MRFFISREQALPPPIKVTIELNQFEVEEILKAYPEGFIGRPTSSTFTQILEKLRSHVKVPDNG